MPGIVGFVTGDPDPNNGRATLSRMLRTMVHDTSYGSGTYAAPELGCYVGWIHHCGSYAACNPLVSGNGEVVLVFTGEHFTHTGSGTSIDGANQSAQAVLKMWEQEGDRFITRLNGWFAGALIDRRDRTVTLFNDRFGMHRVYVHQSPHGITFASEAKALLSVRPDTRALDGESLGHFMAFGTVFNDRTLFKDVSLLPGGSAWKIQSPALVKKNRYFTVATWSEQPPLSPSQFQTAFLRTMSDVLPAYFRSRQPVGLSLTGGLDTRMLTAGMPTDAKPVHAYTYAGIYRDCFDVQVARAVADACHVPHEVIGLQENFFQHFDSHAAESVWISDGTLDVCGTHEIYYSRRARALSPIRLTGNYGSEVLRSVSTFKPHTPVDGVLDGHVERSAADALRSFGHARADHPVTFAAFKEIPWNLFGRLAAAQSQLVVRSPYMDNALVELVYRAPAGSRETSEASLRVIAQLRPALASIETDMAYGGGNHGPSAFLRRLARYAQFKAEWYYNAGMPDWLARVNRTLSLRRLEPLFLGSHKIDHYRLWFQGLLRTYVQDLLRDARSRARGYLNPQGFDRLVRAHADGRGNYLNELNKIMTLELVNRVLLERSYDRQSS